MPLLTREQERTTIAILNTHSVRAVEQTYNEPAKVLSDGNWIMSACLKCSNPRCIKYAEEEVVCTDFPEFAYERDLNVCPVGAIKWDYTSELPEIDNSKCIKCGLCAARCPIGAIYKADAHIMVSKPNSSYDELPYNAENIEKQKSQIKELQKIYWKRQFQKESNAILEQMYKAVKKFDGRSNASKILVRNLMIALGYHCSTSRTGDVYTRMDGVYSGWKCKGAIEIEFGKDTLEASRGILEDIAVLHSRSNIDKMDNKALVVCLSLPNKRQGYFQVIKDVKKVLNLKIQTISLGALLILVWNGANVNFKEEEFYVDFDNMSIREIIEFRITRKSYISEGKLGILEPEK